MSSIKNGDLWCGEALSPTSAKKSHDDDGDYNGDGDEVRYTLNIKTVI